MEILRPHVVESDPAGQSNNDLGEPPKELALRNPQGYKDGRSSSQETQGSTHSV
ncbi:unnamed protein product, partial [Staurois parvus]